MSFSIGAHFLRLPSLLERAACTFRGTLSEIDLGQVAATRVLSWKSEGPVVIQFSKFLLLIQSGRTLFFIRLVAAN